MATFSRSLAHGERFFCLVFSSAVWENRIMPTNPEQSRPIDEIVKTDRERPATAEEIQRALDIYADLGIDFELLFRDYLAEKYGQADHPDAVEEHEELRGILQYILTDMVPKIDPVTERYKRGQALLDTFKDHVLTTRRGSIKRPSPQP